MSDVRCVSIELKEHQLLHTISTNSNSNSHRDSGRITTLDPRRVPPRFLGEVHDCLLVDYLPRSDINGHPMDNDIQKMLDQAFRITLAKARNVLMKLSRRTSRDSDEFRGTSKSYDGKNA